MAIYDTIQYVRPDVRTVCLGQAAMAAAVILAAGAPGKRLALPNSRVLIHQPSAEVSMLQPCDSGAPIIKPHPTSLPPTSTQLLGSGCGLIDQ